MKALPRNIKAGTVVVNVTLNGSLEKLVQPFLYYIDGVTQHQQSRVNQGSRIRLNYRRHNDKDVCEDVSKTERKITFVLIG